MVFASLETIQQAPPATQLYMPMMKRQGLPPNSLGVQVDDSITRYDWQPYLVDYRMYQFPARWAEIEAERGVYEWTPWLDDNVEIVRQLPHASMIIGTKTCPEWARAWPEQIGSPPRYEYWDDYADFVNALIDRYSPWGVEIWNEPDTYPGPYQDYYGAWIPETGDPFQAGQHYAEFVRVVVWKIKTAHPETKLIIGALMGDMRFLEGMASIEGGLVGDYLSIHNYLNASSFFYDTFEKVHAARSISGMDIIITETSVMGDDGDYHRRMQADYIRYLKSGMAYENVPLILWYSLGNDWENTALIRNGATTPAWKEWKK